MRIASARVVQLQELLAVPTAFMTSAVHAAASEDIAYNNPWQTKERTNSRAQERSRYIVQAQSVQTARVSVQNVGGRVRQELTVIHLVSAALSDAQASLLSSRAGLHVFKDRPVETEDFDGSKGSAQIQPQVTSSVMPADTVVVLTDGTGIIVALNQYLPIYPMLVSAVAKA